MHWNSKKESSDGGWIRISAADELVCKSNLWEVVSNEQYKMILRFPSPRHEHIWKLAFINFMPSNAKIDTGDDNLDKSKKYELEYDRIAGIQLRKHLRVNSYYILDSVKGLGAEGTLGFCSVRQKFVAVRYIPKGLVPLILRTPSDVAVLKRISHPNIVSQMEFLFDRESSGIYVIYEHVPEEEDGINLMKWRDNTIKENDARPLIWDLIRALEYLHGVGISHGDIRRETLNISVEGTLKVNPLGALQDKYPIREC